MNKVFLLGRLTRDPEVSTTPNGKIVTKFALAVERFSGSKEADFINIVVWEKLGEYCGNSLSKGQRALVEGRLQIRSYEGKDGQKRWYTDVVAQAVEVLDRRAVAAPNTIAETPVPHDAASQFGHDVAPDDEIPF